MTPEMLMLSALILGAVLCFGFEVFSVDKVSALVLCGLVGMRLVTPEEAIAGFGNSATITVACMLAMSYGIQTTGALNFVANTMVDLARNSERRLLASIIVGVGVLSAFINNTAAVALFLPLTIAAARENNLAASKFLMPMSFAAMFAGTCTLIGTSTNLLIFALALEHMDWRMGMFEFTRLGVILFLVGTLYLLFIGHHLIPLRKPQDNLTEKYQLRDFVTELILQDGSPLIGKSIAETDFRKNYGIEVIEIIRGSKRFLAVSDDDLLENKDILLVQGNLRTLMGMRDSLKLHIKALRVEDRDLEDDNILLVEAFISPDSRLVESTLKEIDFRRTYSANTLAIRSHGRTVRERIGSTRLEYGDSLLILTNREQLEALADSPDFLTLEEVRTKFVRQDKVYFAVGIFAAVILLASLELVTILEAALLGTGMMLVTGCLRLHDLYDHLSWQTLIMLACLIPLGTAMENTGLAAFCSTLMVERLVVWGPTAVLSGIYLATVILTSIMSNTATAILMTPLSLSVASTLQLDPKPFVVAVLFAASNSFMTPVGYQTNLFVFGPGGYRFSDFLRVGTPLSVLFWVLATFLIPFFWPF